MKELAVALERWFAPPANNLPYLFRAYQPPKAHDVLHREFRETMI